MDPNFFDDLYWFAGIIIVIATLIGFGLGAWFA